jgi:hypothetical protein
MKKLASKQPMKKVAVKAKAKTSVKTSAKNSVMSRARIKTAMISKGRNSHAVIATVPMAATAMTASKIANPTSANLINVSPIKLVRANVSKRSASRANALKSANKANVQSAANGPSGPIVMIAATAMSRATRTNRAVIP